MIAPSPLPPLPVSPAASADVWLAYLREQYRHYSALAAATQRMIAALEAEGDYNRVVETDCKSNHEATNRR